MNKKLIILHNNIGDYMYYFNIFFLFSMLGHFIENIFYTSKDSGILFGWWTPIYGIGVVTIILVYNFVIRKIKVNKYIKFFLVFTINAILLSVLELVGGILIEKVFHITFWDYSKDPFSIFRYTSLKMPLIWGISGIGVTFILKPIIDKIVKYIPRFITYILITLFSIDCILTIIPYMTK